MFLFILGAALLFGGGAYDSGVWGQGGKPDWSKLSNPDRPGHLCMKLERALGSNEEKAVERCS